MPTSTLIITVDPDCCRCISKLQKVLCRIQERGEFVIEKILYEGDKVKVSGPFNAEKLYCKLWCKLRNIVKDIQVAPPEKKKEPEKKKPEKPQCKVVSAYPYPWPPCGCPTPFCNCPRTKPPCGCPTPSCDCPRTKPPCGCPPPFCWCHAKPKPTPKPECPKPPSPPPKPPTCGCPTWPSCRCCTYPPYPPYPILVCEESPPYGACTVM